MVQDLETQWLQSYLCKTKTSQETQKNLMKFLEPTRKPKVIYTDNYLEFGKCCEELSGIIVRQHHTDQKQMGWLKEQYRETCSSDIEQMQPLAEDDFLLDLNGGILDLRLNSQ